MKFPYIHDIEELLDRLKKSGLRIPKYVLISRELSSFALVTRYPGLAAPVSRRSYRRALRLAKDVLRWAERQIQQP